MKKVPFETITHVIKQKIYNVKGLPNLIKKYKVRVAMVLGVCVLGSAVFLLWPKHQVVPLPKPPELVVSQPKYVNNQTMIISGQTDPGASILVDGLAVLVQPDGSFKVTLTGNIVSKILRVVATSKAGIENVDELDIIPPDVSARDSLPNIPVAAAQAGTSGSSVLSTPKQTAQANKQIAPANKVTTSYSPGVSINKTAPKPFLTVSVPTKTTNEKVIVTGSGVPGATVVINGMFSATVGSDSKYSATVKLLNSGSNTITATESYKDWGYIVVTKETSVIYVAPPELNILAVGPFNNIISVPTNTSDSYIDLNITIRDIDLANGVSVLIGSQKPVKSVNSTMTYRWDLQTGANTLKIIVTDDVGNSTIKTISVNH